MRSEYAAWLALSQPRNNKPQPAARPARRRGWIEQLFAYVLGR